MAQVLHDFSVLWNGGEEMRCREAHRLISRRIDGLLSALDAAALEGHLADCQACRFAAERLDRAWDALARTDDAPRAPEDWATIEAAAEARSRRWMPRWLQPHLAPAPAAIALLAAMVLGTAAGAFMSRAALAPRRSGPIEATMFAETLGDLPWGSPAFGLAGDTRLPRETNR